MRFDGTDRRTHLTVVGKTSYAPAEPDPAEEIVVSPSGRWALARVNTQLYLLALPQAGGEPPKVTVHEPSVALKKLTDIGADYTAWADGGKTITWAIGSSFFRLPFDSIVFDPLKSDDEAKGADKEQIDAEKKRNAPKPEELAVVIERIRHRPSGSIVLSGAKVITMRGDEIIDQGDIVVTDHRIAAVGPKGSVKAPDGAKVIDMTGKTIVPGFVDTHAHWTDIRRGVLDLQNWSFFANLAYGVTTGAIRRLARTTCSPIKIWSRPENLSAHARSRQGRESLGKTIFSRPTRPRESSPDTKSTTGPTP